jgi:hypothetical protein
MVLGEDQGDWLSRAGESARIYRRRLGDSLGRIGRSAATQDQERSCANRMRINVKRTRLFIIVSAMKLLASLTGLNLAPIYSDLNASDVIILLIRQAGYNPASRAAITATARA